MSPSSSIRDFAQFAGRIIWPRDATELRDTTLCPACLTPLPSPVCPSCGLDLRHPAAGELLTASMDAADAIEKRVQLIGQIRHEAPETEAAVAAATQTSLQLIQEQVQEAARKVAVDQEAHDRQAQERLAEARLAQDRLAQDRLAQDRLSEERAVQHRLAAERDEQEHQVAAGSSTESPSAPPAVAAAASASTNTSAAPVVPPFASPFVSPSAAPFDGTATPPPAAASGAPAEPKPRKRSSVQIVLLLVGVTLVSVAAIFFLTVAWLFAGLAFRSVVVALFTIATLAVAALLRRKNLVSTAEGIGALAVVLVLLDAWAVRQNDLFGLGSGDGLLYWGGTLALCTVLFLAWHALSSLRVASVAGFGSAAPALGLLAAGLSAAESTGTQIFLAALGVAVGALVHPFTRPGTGSHWPHLDRTPERVTLLVLAAVGLGTATVAGAALRPDVTWAPLVALGLVVVLAVVHTGLVLRRPDTSVGSRVFAYGAAAVAALATVLGPVVVSLRTDTIGLLITVPFLAPVLVALLLELTWRRLVPGPRRVAVLVAALTAAAVAANSLIVVGVLSALPLVTALTAGLLQTADPIAEVTDQTLWAVGSLAAGVLLTVICWAVGGVTVLRRRILVTLGLAVLLLAVPFAQWLWLILPLYVLLGGAALALLLLRPRRALGGNRIALLSFVVLAQAGAWCISWASSSSWWLGAVSAVGALFAGRLLLDRSSRATGRAALLAGAIVLTLVGAATAPWALTLAAEPGTALRWLHVSVGLYLGTAVLLLLSALPRIGGFSLTTTERSWAFFTLLPTTLLALIVPTGAVIDLLGVDRGQLAPGELALGLTGALVLLAALLGWPLLRGNRPGLFWPRAGAAVLIAPGLFAVIADLLRLSTLPTTVTGLAPAIAALLALALALALRFTRAPDRALLGIELGAVLVLATSLPRVAFYELGWLVVLLVAVGALISAVDTDGLFASRSPRRHLGWLALVLGTVSLWWGLGVDDNIPVEAYTLPVAGLLLILAALLWRFGRVDRAVTASSGAALLTFAGLLIALMPLAITGQTGSIVRPLLVAGVSAVLLLGAATVRWTPPRSAYLAAAGLAGALGLLVTVATRALRLTGTADDLRLEAWLLPAAVVGVVAAFRLVRHADAPSRVVRHRAAVSLLLVFVTVPAVIEITGFADSTVGTWRALGLTLVLAAAHVLAMRWPRAPLGLLSAWVFAGLALTVGAAGLLRADIEPFELVTVPLGLALVAGQLFRSGAVTIEALPVRRGVLAGGLALTLLPSALDAGGLLTGPADDAGLVRPILTLVIGGLLALSGAELLRRDPSTAVSSTVSHDGGSTVGSPVGNTIRLVAWPALGVGLVAVVLAAVTRILPLYDAAVDGELEAWLLPAAAVVAGCGALLVGLFARVGHTSPAPTDTVVPAGSVRLPSVGFGLLIAAVVGVTLAEAAALDYEPLALARVVVGVWLLAGLHVVVCRAAPTGLGRVLAWVALGSAALLALAGWTHALPDPLELVTVPLGLALLAGRVLSRPATSAGSIDAIEHGRWLVAGGLALALLPSAAASADPAGTDGMLRAVLTLVLGSLLALSGAVLVRRLPQTAPDSGWFDAARALLAWPACLVGLATVLLTVAGRMLPIYAGPIDGELEAWLLPAAVLVVGVGALLAWPPSGVATTAGAPTTSPAASTAPAALDASGAPDSPAPAGAGAADIRRRVGYGLMIGAVMAVVLAEVPALDYGPLALVRVVLVVWLFATLHLAVFWADPSPLGRLLAWVAIGAAGVMVVAGFGQGVPDPIEIVSIPLAIALVASGLLQLDRSPSAGSWPWLAPGLLVLLVPSLLLDLSYSPLWRVVGLGVLAVAVLVIGTVRRLQAPFLIGAVVLLVHGLAQLWPWISLAYGAVPWWLWLGIGGVLLIVLAARYEQRIQNLKTVALRVSALR